MSIVPMLARVYSQIAIIWAMVFYSKHKQDKMANVLNAK